MSIFFIMLLLTTQYARQLSYMGCKLFYKTTTSDCGCDKIVKTIPQNKADAPASTVHKHLHIEDFVKTNISQTSTSLLQLKPVKKYFTYQSPLSFGANNELLRPPNV